MYEWKAYCTKQSLHNFNSAYMHIQVNSIGFWLKVYTNVCLHASCLLHPCPPSHLFLTMHDSMIFTMAEKQTMSCIHQSMQYAYSHNNVHSYIQQILLPPMHHCTTLIRCGKEPHTHAQHDRCSEAVMCWNVGHPALSCMVSPNIFLSISLWLYLCGLCSFL